MNVHKNARLTRVVESAGRVASGQTPGAVAEAAGVCPRTDRYRREGLTSLQDRSFRLHRLRQPMPQAVVEEIDRWRATLDGQADCRRDRRVASHKLGVRIERVMTDNGSCYRSKMFRAACKHFGLRHTFTRPCTPKTNGKAERFIQTALREGPTLVPIATRISDRLN